MLSSYFPCMHLLPLFKNSTHYSIPTRIFMDASIIDKRKVCGDHLIHLDKRDNGNGNTTGHRPHLHLVDNTLKLCDLCAWNSPNLSPAIFSLYNYCFFILFL
ncbi:hypothetical protein PHAVU_008G006300 [Phaseolus vulgaris]|uniref:Uncharacterized protein n=1 Tax=Phaseolus vulgaris TaxID=3885 RepID=V7B2S2_PHAVU|nr:hypothetical protein PHAVU_008G006300g [Phaseolus vulgaris]ESW11153.1 hypothetical protein PHAVU_008G006300g [Phaseolus vulgaris]